MENSSSFLIDGNESCPNHETGQLNGVSKSVFLPLFTVLCLGAISLNVILIIHINRRHIHKYFTRFFLTSLAVIDLCVGIFVMPLSIANEFADLKQNAGAKICLVMNSLDVLFSSASIIHLAFLTFDRYIALCRPLSYPRICCKKNMKILFCVCWIVVGIISFGFIMPGLHHLGFEEQFLLCNVILPNKCIFVVNMYFHIVSAILTFFIPGFCILILNIKVLRRVRHQSIRRKRELNVICLRQKKKNAKTSQSVRIGKIISLLTVCFFVCWLPYFLVCEFELFGSYKVPYVASVAVLWLGYANSALNPLLYLLIENKLCKRKQ